MRRAIVVLSVTAIGVMFLFAGCGGAVSRPAAPQDPSESLMGLWTGREERSEGAYNLISLMFTPERFIFTVIRHNSDGQILWFRTESGTWTATDETIHKRETYDEYVEAEDAHILHENVTSERHYEISDGTLIVDEWDRLSDDLDKTTYKKVDSIPSIFGEWFAREQGSYEDDDGIPVDYTNSWSYRIHRDAFVDSFERDLGDSRISYTFAGDVVKYDADNLFLYVAVSEFETLGFEWSGPPVIGHTLRYALSPTAVPHVIVVSRFPGEQRYDEDVDAWIAKDSSWGEYGLGLVAAN